MTSILVKTAHNDGSTGQVAMTQAEARIYDADANKVGLMVKNIGSSNVYVGETGITAGDSGSGDGWVLTSKEWVSIETRKDIFGICESGETSRICYWEI